MTKFKNDTGYCRVKLIENTVPSIPVKEVEDTQSEFIIDANENKDNDSVNKNDALFDDDEGSRHSLQANPSDVTMDEVLFGSPKVEKVAQEPIVSIESSKEINDSNQQQEIKEDNDEYVFY